MQLISLEKEAKQICEQHNNSFVPTTFGVKVVRERFELEQRAVVYLHDVRYQDVTVAVPTKLGGKVPVRILYPKDLKEDEKLPVLFYVHGGQFISGNVKTHDKLIRELVSRARVAAVFVSYSLAPEVKAPVQLNQLQVVFEKLPELAKSYPFDLSRLLVGGDDVGGTFALALALMHPNSIELPRIYKMVLFCPVTNANFDTNSYHQFAGGYDLTREQMKWSWQQYLGQVQDKATFLYSPLRATFEQLRQLPETLIITAEADVVRDEGEAFARKMRDAGGNVSQIRFQGTIHDFVVKNALDETNACRLAMNVAVGWIRRKAALK
ncbi:alpha/beta hydrolase [Liquorilactobacillus satsumensis]|uniref:alpha/beta hydrolase n=1 Tax=Liquorilactobacillus satsumensis TaxID=259059 RepID=UPI001E37DDB9|nr:alpha/beta hydrolase [Liquorilactobacillus satsumensis]MCC7665915.1 esterase [Liquorilactobacillus satsumensis]MCP9312125.1 alpha/beta hydrolase [Liquorilactobacillus satsumensis]MCP9327788.1 alpha/beta hydrolase [Liquorilactobacillus satsumensis]MCP9356621.1 alpha/beta hydrolase [Liquorilactobacillus satsumensis]MCP9359403.1 alpha/beta hydrolase [Liquorilactobacillus satsumensis]